MLDAGFWMGIQGDVSPKRPTRRGNVKKKWVCNLLGDKGFEGILREEVEIYCVNSAFNAFFNCWAECAQQRSGVVEMAGLWFSTKSPPRDEAALNCRE